MIGIAAALLQAAAPAPAPPAPGDMAAIWQARNESNIALRDRQLERFAAFVTDDVIVVGGAGGATSGKAELRARIAQAFAEKSFVTYVRTPGTVRVATAADSGVRAAEQGRWTGLWRDSRGETRWSGDYMAHWVKTPAGWRIRAEVYVSLACVGPACRD